MNRSGKELTEDKFHSALKGINVMLMRLKGALKRFLAGRKPRLEDVAREMRVSVRTLQRRLLDEGITFQGVGM